MFVLKAFIENALFISATPGIVSTIGELSTQSLTYTKNKRVYLSTLAPELEIIAFTCADNNTPTILSLALSDQIGSIAKYIFNHTIDSHTQVFANILLESLLVDFVGSADSFNCGEIVSDGDYSIPEWVSWRSTLPDATEQSEFKIWFSDTSFQEQYDGFEIVIIPPFDNLDNFFNPASMIRTALNAITPSDWMNRIQTAKDIYPETVIRSEMYTYYDSLNPSNTIQTTWSFLIYGAAGNNIDAISDALIDYILTHSTHTRAQWEQIIPDIFKHTEFIIAPQWHEYGIPNRTLEAGIYSPITNIQKALSSIGKIVPEYPTPHINANVSVVANPYKSISLLVVGSPNNRNNKFGIKDIFPDYIAVQSTSSDFTRMTQSTQDWTTLLERMLIIAETMTSFTTLARGYSKVTREGVLFLTARYENINYLVASKLFSPE